MAERIEGFTCSNTLGEFVDRLSKEVCDGRSETCGLKHRCVPVRIDIDGGKPERLFAAGEVEGVLRKTAAEFRLEAQRVRRGQVTEYKRIGTPEEIVQIFENTAYAFDFVADHVRFQLQMRGGQKDFAAMLAAEQKKEKDQTAATA